MENQIENIVIDDETIQISELSEEGQNLVARVIELRNQMGSLDMQRQELGVLINAYAATIKSSVKAVDDGVIETVN